jgi:hypothetical protein
VVSIGDTLQITLMDDLPSAVASRIVVVVIVVGGQISVSTQQGVGLDGAAGGARFRRIGDWGWRVYASQQWKSLAYIRS